MNDKSADKGRKPAHIGEATSHVVFAVDRREHNVVVLINEAGDALEVEASRLPADCRAEGAVLRVPLGPDSAPVWNAAVRDQAEEQRRRSLLEKRLEKLRRNDPGGNVSL